MGLVDGHGRWLAVPERVAEHGDAGGPNHTLHSQSDRSLKRVERRKRVGTKPVRAGGQVEVRARVSGEVNQYIISMACSEHVSVACDIGLHERTVGSCWRHNVNVPNLVPSLHQIAHHDLP